MRLLSLNERGDLAWTEFTHDTIPPYAILSHRWVSDEVSFVDLKHDNGRSKAGRQKIVFCGEQAARDDGTMIWLEHGDQRTYRTAIRFLRGKDETDAVRSRIRAIGDQPDE